MPQAAFALQQHGLLTSRCVGGSGIWLGWATVENEEKRLRPEESDSQSLCENTEGQKRRTMRPPSCPRGMRQPPHSSMRLERSAPVGFAGSHLVKRFVVTEAVSLSIIIPWRSSHSLENGTRNRT